MLACQLRRLGLVVRLIEKRSGPSIHSKAIGLQYRVSEFLARLGGVDRFLAQRGSPSTINIWSCGFGVAARPPRFLQPQRCPL
jgi:2-polyprenyl-6-methoxyphenol hydroxylase-like FAD-dependent oxidoreductase